MIVVVVGKVIQFILQIDFIPEQRLIQILASYCANKSFYIRMRDRRKGNRLHFFNFQDAKIGFPAMKLKERVVICTYTVRNIFLDNDLIEHAASGWTIDRSLIH